MQNTGISFRFIETEDIDNVAIVKGQYILATQSGRTDLYYDDTYGYRRNITSTLQSMNMVDSTASDLTDSAAHYPSSKALLQLFNRLPVYEFSEIAQSGEWIIPFQMNESVISDTGQTSFGPGTFVDDIDFTEDPKIHPQIWIGAPTANLDNAITYVFVDARTGWNNLKYELITFHSTGILKVTTRWDFNSVSNTLTAELTSTSGYVTAQVLNSQLSNYATLTYVTQQIAAIQEQIGGYAAVIAIDTLNNVKLRLNNDDSINPESDKYIPKGSSILIEDANEPDLWVSNIDDNKDGAKTTVEEIRAALKADGKCKIGYFHVVALGDRIDLSEYSKTADNDAKYQRLDDLQSTLTLDTTYSDKKYAGANAVVTLVGGLYNAMIDGLQGIIDTQQSYIDQTAPPIVGQGIIVVATFSELPATAESGRVASVYNDTVNNGLYVFFEGNWKKAAMESSAFIAGDTLNGGGVV